MADNIPTPEQNKPEITPELPVIDEGLKNDISDLILEGLEQRGLIDGRSPEELAKIVGQAAAGGAINALKKRDAVDPPEGSQPIAEVSMGDVLSEFTKHNGSTDPDKRVLYSSKVDEAALEKAEQAKDAFHDSLTGILNLRGFQKRLDKKLERIQEQAESEEPIPEEDIEPRPVALVLVDLNGLTTINNLKGHATGDKAIQGAAEVLTKTTRKGDIVARIGGDEFWVLICETEPDKGLIAGKRAQEPSGRSTARDASDAIKSFSARAAAGTVRQIDKIEKETEIGLYDLELAIGGVPWDESKTFEEMYEDADAEMYRDKEAKYAAKGKVHLKERQPSPENRIETLRVSVDEIDSQLDSTDITDEIRKDLLDRREAVRLMMAAEILTTKLISEPLPPIKNQQLAMKYLRPSMYIAFKDRLKSEQSGDPSSDIDDLELIDKIIENDKGTRLITKLYSKDTDRDRPTWLDQHTGVSPRDN